MSIKGVGKKCLVNLNLVKDVVDWLGSVETHYEQYFFFIVCNQQDSITYTIAVQVVINPTSYLVNSLVIIQTVHW